MTLNKTKSTITGLNLTKEVLAQHGLSDLTLVMEGSQPAAVVFGHPVGPSSFVDRAMAAVVTKLRALHKALGRVQDPQVELLLARASLGVCRVTHLMRGVLGRCLTQGLDTVDQLCRSTLERIVGGALDADAWIQASLPLRMGGLGMTHSKSMAGAAFTASALGFASRAHSLGLPMEAAVPTEDLREAVASLPQRGAAVADLRQAVAATGPVLVKDPKAMSQRFWGEAVHLCNQEKLRMNSTARSLARLNELKTPIAASWLTPPPAKSLGLSFEAAEFRLLLKWRLGLPILPQPSICPRCGDLADIYGDHAMTCVRASHVARHEGVIDALARVVAMSGGKVQRNVAVAGRLRPADLLISAWGPQQMAVDGTVRHGVGEFDSLGDPLGRAANSKHIKYDEHCRLTKLDFLGFGLTTFGAADEEALEMIRTLKTHLNERFGKREGRELGQQAVERIAVATMRGVGAQLAELVSCAPGEDPLMVDQVRAVHHEVTPEHARWRAWASAHGFEAAPPTNLPESLGVRVLASAPTGALEPEVLQRRLFWEDPALGARVFVRD